MMFVIIETTTGRKYCGGIHRQIWKSVTATDVAFFAEKSSDFYQITTYPSLEKAQKILDQIIPDRAIKIPFETSKEAWDLYSEVIPLLDESEIENPEFEIRELELK